MGLSLRIPRVEVFWGKVNLTCYSGEGVSDTHPLYKQPIVYNVSVNITESGQTPTGSMNWNPSGVAYKIYEQLLTKDYDKIITVRYYYLDGRSITFAFVWSGQQENYGQSMELRVSLSSELDGLVNGIIRSTAQADPKEQKFSMTSGISTLESDFGVDKFKLIEYTAKAAEDMGKAQIEQNYNSGTKFYDAVVSIADTNGNTVFASNIASASNGGAAAAKCIIFTPYSWDKSTPVQELGPTEQTPSPKTRYGYFLGPCLIDTITKQSQWQPQQKRQTLSAIVQQHLQPEPPKQGTATANAQPQTNSKKAKGNASSKPGTTGVSASNSKARLRVADNEAGEDKKILMEEQRQCKLSTTLFMCPALTGLKPYDILFIPNYAGTFMEDWVVSSVEYSQTDGGVNLSVQATRKFALGDFMNPAQGKIWMEKAKSYGLVGEKATLENWMNYAWKPGTSSATTNVTSQQVSGGTANPFSNIPKNGSEITQVSGFTVGENLSTG